MLKDEFIQKLSQPLIDLYIATENKLLLSIVKRLSTGKSLGTAEWELNKLQQMGGLKSDTVKMIAKTNKTAVKMLREILNKATIEALTESGVSTEVTDSIIQVVSALESQAKSTLNVVNTNMLASTINSYGKVFGEVQKERNKILGEATTQVVTGQVTTTQGIKTAIKELSDEGITAFTDKAGRNWSPESYVSMDIVTTSNNVAREVVMQQGRDYGMDIILVSSHGGARPQCEPYQGKCYSMSGRYGKIKDLNGVEYDFEPIQNTTYQKEPAGLFGINCHHTFRYITEGNFVNREKPVLTEEEKERNRIQYAQSQEQRSIERQIRNTQRTADLLNTFEKGAGAEYSQKARDLRAEYREFCKQTGRSEDWIRTQVLT